jgi:hypothetical protein
MLSITWNRARVAEHVTYFYFQPCYVLSRMSDYLEYCCQITDKKKLVKRLLALSSRIVQLKPILVYRTTLVYRRRLDPI